MRSPWLIGAALSALSLSSALAATSDAPADDPFTCSATRPCALGCCSKSGVCGLGPQFCGPSVCQSSCDQKSECDPGWGAQWSSATTCPLKVCCSKFGFCGTTADFCGSSKVQSPSCPKDGGSSNKRTVGYYEGWSTTRKCDGMYPEGIPAGAYTHLNYAFAFIDPNSFAVAPMSDQDRALYPRFTALKDSNPGLQTWISIGGWSMNDPDQPTHSTFSTLAGSAEAQSKFFSSLISFMSTYGFDGVDIDWEYPVAPERSGNPQDFQNYVSFLSNLRNAIGSAGHSYGVTITIPSSFWYMRHFDISNIAKHIDWFNVMLTCPWTYDLHGTWDSTDKYIGPVVNAHTNLTEIDQTMDLLWRNGVNPDQVVLGLGFYGRSFTLTNPSCTSAGCPFSSGGNPGQCSDSAGTLTFAEIERLVAGGATATLVKDAAVKQVVFGGNQWVSYDDAETLSLKIDYANSKCLGGTMIWAASTDDAQGSAAAALSLRTGRKAISLAAVSKQQDNVGSCKWGECGQSCPSGFTAAERGDSPGKNTGIYNGCKDHGTRNFCCPSDNVPKCQWRGTAPLCKDAKCKQGEVEVTSDGSATGKPCWFNHKVLCCESTSTDEAIGKCHWEGSAPICAIFSWQHASCPAGTKELTYSKFGAGGESQCYPTSGYKSLCCTQPPPYQNCNWQRHDNRFNLGFPLFCGTQCPAGKTPIATDPFFCVSGVSYFCCDGPTRSPDPAASTVHNLLELFGNNPTCKGGIRSFSKRDEFSAESIAALEGRADTLTKPQLSQLTAALAAAFLAIRNGAQSSVQSDITADFDRTLGPTLDLTSQRVVGFYGTFADEDPVGLTESLMCLGSRAGRYLSDQAATTSCVCVLPSTIRPGSSGAPAYDPHPSKKKRNIDLFWGDGAGNPQDGTQPTIGTMLRGVIDGQLQFMYTRLIRYNGAHSGQQEGIIEMAWRITNDQYRSAPGDQYFVMHAHTTHVLVYGANSDRYPGVYQVNAFHGQHFDYAQNRVAGIDQHDENHRTEVVECVHTAGDYTYMYPGNPTDPCDAGRDDGRVQEWGHHVRNQGVLDGNTYALVGGGAPPDSNGLVTNLNWNGLQFGESPSFTQGGGTYQPPGGLP